MIRGMIERQEDRFRC